MHQSTTILPQELADIIATLLRGGDSIATVHYRLTRLGVPKEDIEAAESLYRSELATGARI